MEVTAFYGGLEFGNTLNLGQQKPHTATALMMVFFFFIAAGLARLFGIFRFGFEGLSQPIVTVLKIYWSLAAYWIAKKIRHGF